MRSAADWARIRMTGACVGDEEIRLRNLPYEDFILEVQRDALSSSAKAIEQLHKEGKLFAGTYDHHDGFGPEPMQP